MPVSAKILPFNPEELLIQRVFNDRIPKWRKPKRGTRVQEDIDKPTVQNPHFIADFCSH